MYSWCWNPDLLILHTIDVQTAITQSLLMAEEVLIGITHTGMQPGCLIQLNTGIAIEIQQLTSLGQMQVHLAPSIWQCPGLPCLSPNYALL